MCETAQHLRDNIGYNQNRIVLVDNKCSFLIGIQAALVAVVTFVVDKVFLGDPLLRTIGYITIAGMALFSGLIVVFLLQTLRPTNRFFSIFTGLNWMTSNGIMWLDMKNLVDQDCFARRVQNLEHDLIIRDLQALAYNQYCLIFTKYHSYRKAIFLTRLQTLLLITFGVISFLTLIHEMLF